MLQLAMEQTSEDIGRVPEDYAMDDGRIVSGAGIEAIIVAHAN